MYAAIRRGKIKPGSLDEIERRVNEGAIPILSGMSGFKGYYLVHAEDDTAVVISLFEDQATAEESNRQMLGWIRENLAPYLVGPPEAMAGKVVVHKGG